MKNVSSRTKNEENFFDRNSLLSVNALLIEQLHKRIKLKRFKPTEGDGLKLAYARVLLQALQVQNSILRDTELDEIKKRLDALEGSRDPSEYKSVLEVAEE